MRALWLKIFLFPVFLFLLLQFYDSNQRDMLSQKHALSAARQTEEYPAFIAFLSSLRLTTACVKEEAVRPCDSDWVSCIEDAWVATFSLKQECLKHDGRLSLTIVVDSKQGTVISKYPEKGYFEDSAYCLEDYDCLCFEGRENDCSNFFHSSVSVKRGEQTGEGQCFNGQCRMPGSR